MMKRLSKAGSIGMHLLIFATICALTTRVLPQLPLQSGKVPRKDYIHIDSDPEPNTFFVSRGSRERSHLALYHDIGPSIEQARASDILIIGNSRAQLGFSETILRGEAEKLGLRVFNLALGHAERARYALDLIRKYDLRPRLVIANGGPHFYRDRYSRWANEVASMSPFQAHKAYFESGAGWQVQRRLHRYLPHLEYFPGGRYPWIHYRAQDSGWWRNLKTPRSRYPVSVNHQHQDFSFTLGVARELQRELASRGTQLVLTILPYTGTQTGHLPLLARELNVPYIQPEFEGLQTADGSHLAPESAKKVSIEIWQRLLQLPEFITHAPVQPHNKVGSSLDAKVLLKK